MQKTPASEYNLINLRSAHSKQQNQLRHKSNQADTGASLNRSSFTSLSTSSSNINNDSRNSFKLTSTTSDTNNVAIDDDDDDIIIIDNEPKSNRNSSNIQNFDENANFSMDSSPLTQSQETTTSQFGRARLKSTEKDDLNFSNFDDSKHASSSGSFRRLFSNSVSISDSDVVMESPVNVPAASMAASRDQSKGESSKKVIVEVSTIDTISLDSCHADDIAPTSTEKSSSTTQSSAPRAVFTTSQFAITAVVPTVLSSVQSTSNFKYSQNQASVLDQTNESIEITDAVDSDIPVQKSNEQTDSVSSFKSILGVQIETASDKIVNCDLNETQPLAVGADKASNEVPSKSAESSKDVRISSEIRSTFGAKPQFKSTIITRSMSVDVEAKRDDLVADSMEKTSDKKLPESSNSAIQRVFGSVSTYDSSILKYRSVSPYFEQIQRRKSLATSKKPMPDRRASVIPAHVDREKRFEEAAPSSPSSSLHEFGGHSQAVAGDTPPSKTDPIGSIEASDKCVMHDEKPADPEKAGDEELASSVSTINTLAGSLSDKINEIESKYFTDILPEKHTEPIEISESKNSDQSKFSLVDDTAKIASPGEKLNKTPTAGSSNVEKLLSSQFVIAGTSKFRAKLRSTRHNSLIDFNASDEVRDHYDNFLDGLYCDPVKKGETNPIKSYSLRRLNGFKSANLEKKISTISSNLAKSSGEAKTIETTVVSSTPSPSEKPSTVDNLEEKPTETPITPSSHESELDLRPAQPVAMETEPPVAAPIRLTETIEIEEKTEIEINEVPEPVEISEMRESVEIIVEKETIEDKVSDIETVPTEESIEETKDIVEVVEAVEKKEIDDEVKEDEEKPKQGNFIANEPPVDDLTIGERLESTKSQLNYIKYDELLKKSDDEADQTIDVDDDTSMSMEIEILETEENDDQIDSGDEQNKEEENVITIETDGAEEEEGGKDEKTESVELELQIVTTEEGTEISILSANQLSEEEDEAEEHLTVDEMASEEIEEVTISESPYVVEEDAEENQPIDEQQLSKTVDIIETKEPEIEPPQVVEEKSIEILEESLEKTSETTELTTEISNEIDAIAVETIDEPIEKPLEETTQTAPVKSVEQPNEPNLVSEASEMSSERDSTEVEDPIEDKIVETPIEATKTTAIQESEESKVDDATEIEIEQKIDDPVSPEDEVVTIESVQPPQEEEQKESIEESEVLEVEQHTADVEPETPIDISNESEQPTDFEKQQISVEEIEKPVQIKEFFIGIMGIEERADIQDDVEIHEKRVDDVEMEVEPQQTTNKAETERKPSIDKKEQELSVIELSSSAATNVKTADHEMASVAPIVRSDEAISSEHAQSTEITHDFDFDKSSSKSVPSVEEVEKCVDVDTEMAEAVESMKIKECLSVDTEPSVEGEECCDKIDSERVPSVEDNEHQDAEKVSAEPIELIEIPEAIDSPKTPVVDEPEIFHAPIDYTIRPSMADSISHTVLPPSDQSDTSIAKEIASTDAGKAIDTSKSVSDSSFATEQPETEPIGANKIVYSGCEAKSHAAEEQPNEEQRLIVSQSIVRHTHSTTEMQTNLNENKTVGSVPPNYFFPYASQMMPLNFSSKHSEYGPSQANLIVSTEQPQMLLPTPSQSPHIKESEQSERSTLVSVIMSNKEVAPIDFSPINLTSENKPKSSSSSTENEKSETCTPVSVIIPNTEVTPSISFSPVNLSSSEGKSKSSGSGRRSKATKVVKRNHLSVKDIIQSDTLIKDNLTVLAEAALIAEQISSKVGADSIALKCIQKIDSDPSFSAPLISTVDTQSPPISEISVSVTDGTVAGTSIDLLMPENEQSTDCIPPKSKTDEQTKKRSSKSDKSGSVSLRKSTRITPARQAKEQAETKASTSRRGRSTKSEADEILDYDRALEKMKKMTEKKKATIFRAVDTIKEISPFKVQAASDVPKKTKCTETYVQKPVREKALKSLRFKSKSADKSPTSRSKKQEKEKEKSSSHKRKSSSRDKSQTVPDSSEQETSAQSVDDVRKGHDNNILSALNLVERKPITKRSRSEVDVDSQESQPHERSSRKSKRSKKEGDSSSESPTIVPSDKTLETTVECVSASEQSSRIDDSLQSLDNSSLTVKSFNFSTPTKEVKSNQATSCSDKNYEKKLSNEETKYMSPLVMKKTFECKCNSDRDRILKRIREFNNKIPPNEKDDDVVSLITDSIPNDYMETRTTLIKIKKIFFQRFVDLLQQLNTAASHYLYQMQEKLKSLNQNISIDSKIFDDVYESYCLLKEECKNKTLFTSAAHHHFENFEKFLRWWSRKFKCYCTPIQNKKYSKKFYDTEESISSDSNSQEKDYSLAKHSPQKARKFDDELTATPIKAVPDAFIPTNPTAQSTDDNSNTVQLIKPTPLSELQDPSKIDSLLLPTTTSSDLQLSLPIDPANTIISFVSETADIEITTKETTAKKHSSPSIESEDSLSKINNFEPSGDALKFTCFHDQLAQIDELSTTKPFDSESVMCDIPMVPIELPDSNNHAQIGIEDHAQMGIDNTPNIFDNFNREYYADKADPTMVTSIVYSDRTDQQMSIEDVFFSLTDNHMTHIGNGSLNNVYECAAPTEILDPSRIAKGANKRTTFPENHTFEAPPPAVQSKYNETYPSVEPENVIPNQLNVPENMEDCYDDYLESNYFGIAMMLHENSIKSNAAVDKVTGAENVVNIAEQMHPKNDQTARTDNKGSSINVPPTSDPALENRIRQTSELRNLQKSNIEELSDSGIGYEQTKIPFEGIIPYESEDPTSERAEEMVDDLDPEGKLLLNDTVGVDTPMDEEHTVPKIDDFPFKQPSVPYTNGSSSKSHSSKQGSEGKSHKSKRKNQQVAGDEVPSKYQKSSSRKGGASSTGDNNISYQILHLLQQPEIEQLRADQQVQEVEEVEPLHNSYTHSQPKYIVKDIRVFSNSKMKAPKSMKHHHNGTDKNSNIERTVEMKNGPKIIKIKIKSMPPEEPKSNSHSNHSISKRREKKYTASNKIYSSDEDEASEDDEENPNDANSKANQHWRAQIHYN